MAPLGRAAGVLCAAFVIAAAIWLGRYSPWALLSEARVKADEAAVWEKEKKVLQTYAEDLKEREQQRKIAWQKQIVAWQKQEELERPEYERPKVADKPPFPKLAIDAPIFDMGAMLVDQTTGHKFKIRNVGRAPLIVSRGPAPCKTTPQSHRADQSTFKSRAPRVSRHPVLQKPFVCGRATPPGRTWT
jgi:hypothetical protein